MADYPSTLEVEVVSADRSVWSGEASSITARTVEGDVGILPGHSPVLAVLEPSGVVIHATSGDRVVIAVDGGFVSVARGRVSILSQYATLGHEIDPAKARAELDALESADDLDDDDLQRIAEARARVKAAELAR